MRDPRYAQIAKVLRLFLPKIDRSGRRRRKFNAFALKNASPSLKPGSWKRQRSLRMVSLQLYHLLTRSTRKKWLNLWSVRQISPGFLQTLQSKLSILLYLFLAVPDRYRQVPRLPLGSQGRLQLMPGHCASPCWKHTRVLGLLVLDPVLLPSTRL